MATEQIPKPKVIAGKNHPGPIHLHAIYSSQNPCHVASPCKRAHVAWNLKNNIRDEEDGKHRIVVVVDELEVFAETGQFRIACDCQRPSNSSRGPEHTDVSTVDEAEQVHESHGRHNAQIDLQTQA